MSPARSYCCTVCTGARRQTIVRLRLSVWSSPPDTAFGKLQAGTVDTLVMPENKQMLTGILTYHVVPGMLDSKAIGKMIKAGKGSAKLTTVAGGTLTATMEGKTLVLTDAKGGKSRVQIANVYQSNGVIHSVDSVLMPN